MARSEFTLPTQLVVKPGNTASGRIAWAVSIAALTLAAYLGYRLWRASSLTETPPVVTPVGPTIVQLERLQYLVSTRVHVADILLGESRWLHGSWVVQGDALLGVDMSKAEIRGKDDRKRSAVIVLCGPVVMSPRVDHKKTQKWDIKSKSWIPFASSILGDEEALQKEAMLEAQRLVERAASSPEHVEAARRDIEGALREFYGEVDWHVNVHWKKE